MLGGEQIVRVHGSGFIERPGRLACRFSGVGDVLATFVSPSEVHCRAPIATAAAAVTVEVSNDGVTFSDDGAVFAFREPVFVASISPEAGPETGGTVVVLHGSGFSRAFAYACEFGAGLRAPATVYSARSIACIAPARPIGAVAISVLADGERVSARGWRTAPSPTSPPHASTRRPTAASAAGGALLGVAATCRVRHGAASACGRRGRHSSDSSARAARPQRRCTSLHRALDLSVNGADYSSAAPAFGARRGGANAISPIVGSSVARPSARRPAPARHQGVRTGLAPRPTASCAKLRPCSLARPWTRAR